MRDKSCLAVSHVFNNDRDPDYHPVSLKQAKEQMKQACKGKTNTNQLLGIYFRMDHLSDSDRDRFDLYCEKICNNKLKQWNKANKK